jgi:hypothetical protein
MDIQENEEGTLILGNTGYNFLRNKPNLEKNEELFGSEKKIHISPIEMPENNNEKIGEKKEVIEKSRDNEEAFMESSINESP